MLILISKCFGSFPGCGDYHKVPSTVKMMLMKEWISQLFGTWLNWILKCFLVLAVCDTTQFLFFGSLLPGWSNWDDVHMCFCWVFFYWSNIVITFYHEPILLHITRCDPTRWSFVWSRDQQDHLSQSPIWLPGGQVLNFPSWWSLYLSYHKQSTWPPRPMHESKCNKKKCKHLTIKEFMLWVPSSQKNLE